jgi:raffinose/stachyose/melibiose transport system permease protein
MVRRGGRIGGDLVAHAALIVACLGIVLPCVFLLFGSVKHVAEFFGDPFALPADPAWSNFSDAWRQGGLGTALRVSTIVTVGSVAASTLLSALLSYSIACLHLRWGQFFKIAVVAGLVVPVQLIMLAIFVIMRQLDLLGSGWSLFLTYTTFGIPLGVLVLVGFFEAVPRSLLEAAWLDGAGHLAVFVHIVVPLSGPALITVSILNGVWIWNDVFVALMLSTTEATRTLPLAILNFFGTYSSEWGLIFAGVVISAIPVLVAYVLSTRTFMKALTAGALKE